MSDNLTIDCRGATRQVASSMQALERRFEVVADNLANLETPGHKRLVVSSHGSSDEADGTEGEFGGAQLSRDFSQGDLIDSGDPNDLALDGEGFFAVEHEDRLHYVRGVHLVKGVDGTLFDAKGARLLGEAGPIRVPNDAVEVTVEADGTVAADRVPVGRLRVVTFVDPQLLAAEGGGRYAAPDGAEIVAASATTVAQGSRERSNTEPVRELVEMIVVQRQYDAAQRALMTESELRQRLNELSR
jgi:flagellar basal body rod protein FlgG